MFPSMLTLKTFIKLGHVSRPVKSLRTAISHGRALYTHVVQIDESEH